MAYTPTGTYNDAAMSAEDRKRVADFSAAYKAAQAAGDTAGMTAAHQGAGAIRRNYGYSGGADGSNYTALNSDGSYKATGTYNDQIVNPQHQAQIAEYKAAFDRAQKAGDTAGMQAAHQGAEAIRSMYGYSGGTDGSNYAQTGLNTQLPMTQLETPTLADIGEAPTLYAGTSQEDAINALYAAKEAAARQQLTSAYNQSMLDYAAQEAKIPGTYDAMRNQTSAQHELERQNYNEYAAGTGLNTGAAGQIRLAQNNAYLGNMNALNKAQADAVSALQLERTKAQTAYQDAIAQAVLDNDTQRAQALYQEYQRVDNNLVENSLAQAQLNLNVQQAQHDASADQANLGLAYDQLRHNQTLDQMQLDLTRDDTQYARQHDAAETLAQYGDFSGYRNLGYSDEQINTMNYMWRVLNGLEAYGGGSGGSSGGSSGGGGGSSSGGSKSGSQSGPGTGGNNNSSNSGTPKKASNTVINNFQHDNNQAFLSGQISYLDMLQNNKDFAKALKQNKNAPKNATTK